MEGASDPRARLTLLGGFLGSGKTTWLRHQLHHGLMRDALIVVNEAAEVAVDDTLLYRSSEIRTVAGGCACCEARDELVAVLRDFCNARVGGGGSIGRFDHVVLETSGLADPGPIVEAIRSDPVLMHHLVVQEIVVVVDALHGLGYLGTEPLGRRQAEMADRLVVTKTDAARADDLIRLLATLRALNPGAVISGAALGSEVPLPDFSSARPAELGDAAGRGEPVRSTVIDLDPAMDWTVFGLWLSALLHARGEDILRVKGVVRTPSGRLLLQSVCKVVQSPEMLPDSVADARDDNRIVFIGRGFRPADLRASLAYFAGEEGVAPADEMEGTA